MQQAKTNKNTINFLLIFGVVFAWLSIVQIDISYLLVLGLILGIGLICHTKWYNFLIALVVCVISSIILFFNHQFNLFDHLGGYIDHLFHYSVRSHLVNYVNASYDETTSQILSLLIFNIKKDAGYDLYKAMCNLSIVYLIVISGFHLSLVERILIKIFKKHQVTTKVFTTIFVAFYTYLLNFSISACRVLIADIWFFILYKSKQQKYAKTCLSGITSLLIYPQVVANYGFCMSYLCAIGIIFIGSWKINNLVIEQIVINLFAFLISLPYVANMNHSISLFAIINSFIFSYFIMGIFIITLLIFWIKWIAPIQKFLVLLIIGVVDAFNNLNIQIYLNVWPVWLTIVYGSFLVGGSYIINQQINKI